MRRQVRAAHHRAVGGGGVLRIGGNPFVIACNTGERHMRNLNDPWEIVRERARPEDLRIRDCRHGFASGGPALGQSLPMKRGRKGRHQSRGMRT